MGKLNLHRGSLQLRVLTLTLLFTLGVSIVITVSNMHQLNAEWERTTLQNAEYALQTAAAAISRDLDEVDDLRLQPIDAHLPADRFRRQQSGALDVPDDLSQI